MVLLDVILLVSCLCNVQGLPLVNRLSGRPNHVVHYHKNGDVSQAHIHIKRGFDPATATVSPPSKHRLTGRHGSQQFRGRHTQSHIDVKSLISQYKHLHSRFANPNSIRNDVHRFSDIRRPEPARRESLSHSDRPKLAQLVGVSDIIPAPFVHRLENYTPPSQETTQHVGLITKRGITNMGSFSANMRTPPPRSYVENFFHLRVWNSSKKSETKTSTPKPFEFRAGHLHTGVHDFQTNQVLPSVTPAVVTSKAPTNTKPRDVVATVVDAVNDTSSASPNNGSKLGKTEVVRLEGIHIMFSNALQNTSVDIPTIHLTAAIDNGVVGKTPAFNKLSLPTSTKGNITDTSATDTIVGTAVIRNGHLYLVVYPFGNKKEVNIKMSNETLKLNRTTTETNETMTEPRNKQLPRNKPLSLRNETTGIGERKKEIILAPVSANDNPGSMEFKSSTKTAIADETTKATPVQTLPNSSELGTNHHMDMKPSHSKLSESMPPKTSIKSSIRSFELPKGNSLSMLDLPFDHAHEHHMQMTPDHHGHHADQHAHTSEMSGVIDSVQRYMSPWKGLNMTEVFPHPKIKTHLDKNSDDDNDISMVVPFIANATDPFGKIQKILAKIADQSNNNSDTSVGAFNFEIKLQGDVTHMDGTRHSEHTTNTPVNENTSEERTTVESWATRDTERETSTPTSHFPMELHRHLFEEMKTSIKTRIDIVPTLTTSRNNNRRVKATKAPGIIQPFTKATSLLDEYLTDFNSNVTTPERFTKLVTFKQPLTSGVLRRQQINSRTLPPKTASSGRQFASPDGRKVKDAQGSHVTSSRNIISGATSAHRIPTQQVAQIVSESHAEKNSIKGNQMDRSNTRRVDSGGFEPPYLSLNASSQSASAPKGSNHRTGQNGVHSDQAGHIISLADILKDMNRIQLQNIHRFDAHNSNPLLSEVQQPIVKKVPVTNTRNRAVYRDSAAHTRLSQNIPDFSRSIVPRERTYGHWNVPRNQIREAARRLPTRIRHEPHPVSRNRQRNVMHNSNRHSTSNNNNVMRSDWNDPFALNNAMDAMLVLSVDDILAEHATLHGAIVLANRDGSSSSSSSSSSSNK